MFLKEIKPKKKKVNKRDWHKLNRISNQLQREMKKDKQGSSSGQQSIKH